MDKQQRNLLEEILRQNFDEATQIAGYEATDVASVMVTIAIDKYLDAIGYLPTIILFQDVCMKLTAQAAQGIIDKKNSSTT